MESRVWAQSNPSSPVPTGDTTSSLPSSWPSNLLTAARCPRQSDRDSSSLARDGGRREGRPHRNGGWTEPGPGYMLTVGQPSSGANRATQLAPLLTFLKGVRTACGLS